MEQKNTTPAARAAALLNELSVEEKLHQLSAQMLYDVAEDYEAERDPLCGCYRNPGHFMHQRGKVSPPAEVAKRINRDVEMSMAAQPHGIPPLEHGETLHGAQWGMASIFPQPIGMAASFDPALTEQIADVIGKETAAVGVRQSLSPVVNLARDVRWGRTVETFGEDPLLAADMGAAMCRGLQKNGVAATPKHFVDNYADGGRDSNASLRSERELRETYLRPFEACIKTGGAKGVMAAYNSLFTGRPAHCDPWLLTRVLREEWGFDGIVVSDYGGVDGVAEAHRLARDIPEAFAMCLKAGLDVALANFSYETVKEAWNRGLFTEAEADRAVLRLLTLKFSLGLFDSPYADPEAAQKLVRCPEHRTLALEAAKKSLVLLKNDGLLPLRRDRVKTLGVFGPGADILPVGSNYSGPYSHPWEAPDVRSPLAWLKEHAGGVTVITGPDADIPALAPQCDAALYFTAVVEGEGLDRADLRLPAYARAAVRDENAVVVDKTVLEIKVDQEASIRALAEANPNAGVVLLCGAPVDMRGWINGARAVLAAWYPGEGGSRALWDTLWGDENPGGKLPVTWPLHAGQLPLYYGRKPSGRGYGYADNDGRPLFPFGFGLSYTKFALCEPSVEKTETGWAVTVPVTNAGDRDGDEVVQIYLHAEHCRAAMPELSLAAYRRVRVKRGETVRASLFVPETATWYYDETLRFGPHGGDFSLRIGTSAENLPFTVELKSK